MAIEYVVSAGEGTLIDYGVADAATLYQSAIIARRDSGKRHYEYVGEEMPLGTCITLLAENCPDDCETGK